MDTASEETISTVSEHRKEADVRRIMSNGEEKLGMKWERWPQARTAQTLRS